MSNFYRQNRKLFNVLLVALFVAGGFGVVLNNVRASWQDQANQSGSSGRVVQQVQQVQTDNPSLSTPVLKATAASSPTSDMTAEQKAAALAAVKGVATGPNAFEQIIGSMVAWFLYYIAVGLGYIMMLITKVMLIIAVFNSFLKQPAVQVGWTITRDICNNFFIIFMMILAAGITLNMKGYAWRTMLPKILIFAVLINFSMTITGVLIDVSQVLMLTFASPLATTQGYNIIISAFGLPDAYSMTKVIEQWKDGSNGLLNNSNGVGFFDIVAALLFAIIVTIVAIVVITCITVILVYRIVMLMFLVILSPLYFLSQASNVSALGKVAGEWTGKLSNMLIVGPAMMFFLYLSFMTMAAVNNLNGTSQNLMLQGDSGLNKAVNAQGSVGTNATGQSITTPLAAQTNLGAAAQSGQALNSQQDYTAISNMASVTGVINFLVVVGLLWASLMMGKKFGDAAGSVAGKGMSWIAGAAKKYSGFNLGKKGVAQLQKAPGAIVSGAVGKVGTGTLAVSGAALRGIGKEGGMVNALGQVAGGWRKDVLKSRRDARVAKFVKFAGKLGMSDETKATWGEFTNTEGAKRAKVIATGGLAAVVGAGAAGLATIATGGLAAPLLAGLAASYVAGGGRLGEIIIGQESKKRAAELQAQKDKIKTDQGITGQVVEDAENIRTNNIETDSQAAATYAPAETARQEMAKIEAAKNKNGKLNVGNLPADFVAYLRLNGLTGNKISDSDLESAKKSFKSQAGWTGRETAVESHQKEVERITSREDLSMQRNVSRTLDSKVASGEITQAEKDRWQGEYVAKAKLQIDSSKLESELKAELAAINSGGSYGGVNYAGKSPMERAEAQRQAQARSDAAMGKVNSQYSQEVQNVQVKTPPPTLLGSATLGKVAGAVMKDYEPYAHENWVSQQMADKARKEAQVIKDMIASFELGGSDLLDGFSTFSRGSFYSGSGQTNQQFKIIDALTKSSKGITEMVAALNALPKELSGDQAKLVEEMKKGIAAYGKGGGDTSKLAPIISALDIKVSVDKNGLIVNKKTVNDYDSEVKAKK